MKLEKKRKAFKRKKKHATESSAVINSYTFKDFPVMDTINAMQVILDLFVCY